MFTFSFSTAFAAPASATLVSADQARAKIEAEYLEAIAALDKAMAAQLETYFPGTATTTTISGASYDIVITEAVAEAVMAKKAYAVYKAAIDQEYDRICRVIETAIADSDFVAFTTVSGGEGDAYPEFTITDYDYNAGDYGNETSVIGNFHIFSEDGTSSAATKTQTAIEQFKANKAATEEAISAIVTSVYSEKVMPGSEDTYREVAEEIVANALTALGNMATPDNITKAYEGIEAIKAIYTPAVGAAKPTGYLYAGGHADYNPGLNNLLKVAGEAAFSGSRCSDPLW